MSNSGMWWSWPPPIPIEQRDEFLRALAGELRLHPDSGAGELHRLCFEVRRRITPWATTMAANIRYFRGRRAERRAHRAQIAHLIRPYPKRLASAMMREQAANPLGDCMRSTPSTDTTGAIRSP
jgi:hypothetical protein